MNPSTDQNPFSAPTADAVPTQADESNPNSLDSIARATFLAWEKLRLIYIAIMGVITGVVCLACYPFPLVELWIILPAALLANFFYFTGPAVDTYVRWLGYRESWPRIAMFVAGTCFSGILAVLVLFENLK